MTVGFCVSGSTAFFASEAKTAFCVLARRAALFVSNRSSGNGSMTGRFFRTGGKNCNSDPRWLISKTFLFAGVTGCAVLSAILFFGQTFERFFHRLKGERCFSRSSGESLIGPETLLLAADPDAYCAGTDDETQRITTTPTIGNTRLSGFEWRMFGRVIRCAWTEVTSCMPYPVPARV